MQCLIAAKLEQPSSRTVFPRSLPPPTNVADVVGAELDDNDAVLGEVGCKKASVCELANGPEVRESDVQRRIRWRKPDNAARLRVQTWRQREIPSDHQKACGKDTLPAHCGLSL
jgi:hypothetical protein